MKTYLVVTGIIFGLMAFLHAWREIAEWPHLKTNPLELFVMTALGLLSAILCVCAFRLLRRIRA